MKKKKVTLADIIKRWKHEREKHNKDYARLVGSAEYKIVIENLKQEKTTNVPVL